MAAPHLNRRHVRRAIPSFPWSAVAAVLIGFAVRLIDLEGPSIWIDELITRERMLMSPGELWADLLRHVPLYFFTLHPWARYFGTDPFFLRLPSVFFGTLTIAQMYLLGRQLYDRRIGVLAALIAAISPFLVFYSRMARPYPLLWFLVLTMINLYLAALRRPTWGRCLAFALAAVAAIYTHLTAVVMLGVLGLYSLYHWKALRPVISKWVVVGLLLIVACLPLASKFLTAPGSPAVTHEPLYLGEIAELYISWNLDHAVPITALTLVIVALAFGPFAVAGLFARKPDTLAGDEPTSRENRSLSARMPGDREWLLLGLLATLPILAIIAKLLNSNQLPFSSRSLSVSSLPYYVLLAYGITRLRPTALRGLLIAVCGVAMPAALFVARDTNAGIDWRTTAHYIQAREGEGDGVLVTPGDYLPALTEYYTGAADLVDGSDLALTADSVSTVLASLMRYKRVWVITVNEAEFDPSKLVSHRLEGACRLSEELELIPRHAYMRLYQDCVWDN